MYTPRISRSESSQTAAGLLRGFDTILMTTPATRIQLKSLGSRSRSTVLSLLSDRKPAKYGRGFMFAG